MKRIESIHLAFTADPVSAIATDTLTVTVATNGQLQRKSHYRRLGIAYAALDVPRRSFPNVLADTIYEFEGAITWINGMPFVLADNAVDDAFGGDGSFRWLSDFKRFVEIEPRQQPQDRIIPRLRLIDLYFRIKHPARARWIAE